MPRPFRLKQLLPRFLWRVSPGMLLFAGAMFLVMLYHLLTGIWPDWAIVPRGG